jgi:hypothetical protein
MRLERLLPLCLAVMLFAAGSARAAETNEPAGPDWFPVGEELVYDIHWGVIGVGQTHVITDWFDYEGRRVIRIRYITKTNKFVANFYPVDDLIESLIDPETFLPIRFTKRLKEGRYRCDEITHFNFRKLKAGWESKLNGRKKAFPIEKDTRDIVTFMYYLRSQHFEPGEKLAFRVMADEKLYDLNIAVGDRVTMRFPEFGEVPSIRLDPEAAFQGLFVRSGKVVAWISDDDRRLCTRLMVSVPVANVRLTLHDVRGPGSETWTRKRDAQRTAETGDWTGGLTQSAGED